MYRLALKITHLFQRLLLQMSLFPKYVRNFGVYVAVMIVFDRLFPPGRTKQYQRAIYHYLDSRYKNLTTKYDNKDLLAETSEPVKAAQIIWVCWLQGEDAMPELVKMCYENLKQQIAGPNISLRLLTHENIDQYVEIPQHIKHKYNKGIISNAHYSDILRFKILRTYGGCWMDATIFVTRRIEADLFSSVFNTMKMRHELCPNEPCRGLWSGFFLVGRKGFPLFCIIDDCLDDYWKSHDQAIDYIFFDYLMLVAYHNNSAVRTVMDAVPYNNEELWYLWRSIEQPYSTSLLDDIHAKGQFYKLSYQKELRKQIDGQQTVYGYLVSK